MTWGSALYGGDSSSVSTKLHGAIDVVRIVANESAFSVIRDAANADGPAPTCHVVDGDPH